MDGSVRILNTCPPAAAGGEIVAYNTQSFDRMWCGNAIKPHSIHRFQPQDVCEDPVYLFHEKLPPFHGRKMPPITLRLADSKAKSEPVRCNIGCRVAMDNKCHKPDKADCLTGSINKFTVDETDLAIIYSTLTPWEEETLVMDRKGKYLATRSFQSDVPLSYFSWSKYGIPTPPVDYAFAEKSVSFFKSDLCKGVIRADLWAKAIPKDVPLASYGSCVHNTDLPKDMSLDNHEDREILMKKHLFHLVIDKSLEKDFVEEEVFQALSAGVIPVYFGAPNILDHVPPNSIISAADYGKEGTAARIQEIANNRTLWESFHEWRTHEFPQHLKEKFAFTRDSPLCRVCRWSYSKKYGLGWNHTIQQVKDKTMSGELCFSRRVAVASPFEERWMTPTISQYPRGGCSKREPRNGIVNSTDLRVNRTMLQHDGITDIVIHEANHTEGELVIRLDFDVQNLDGAHFTNVHQLVPSDRVPIMTSLAIQDDRQRVTVICDWPAKVASPGEGIIAITVQKDGESPLLKDETRIIRVIPEDLDPARDVRSEYSLSHYTRRMIEDFSNPLELFAVES